MASERSMSFAVPGGDGVRMLPLALRRRAGLRRITLAVTRAGGLRLSVPSWVSDAEALRFADSRRDWVCAVLGRQDAAGPSSLVAFLRAQGWVSLLGSSFPLVFEDDAAPAFHCDATAGCVLLRGLGTGPDAEGRAREWLRALASRAIPSRVVELAAKAGERIGRVSVRDQDTRWGSCSTGRNLSLNWRLLLLEPPLHDHVIWHELAHLRHMDHSVEFWAHLRALDPGTKHHDKALTAVSRQVMRLGRA